MSKGGEGALHTQQDSAVKREITHHIVTKYLSKKWCEAMRRWEREASTLSSGTLRCVHHAVSTSSVIHFAPIRCSEACVSPAALAQSACPHRQAMCWGEESSVEGCAQQPRW